MGRSLEGGAQGRGNHTMQTGPLCHGENQEHRRSGVAVKGWDQARSLLPSGDMSQREYQVPKTSAKGEQWPLEIPGKSQGTQGRIHTSQT